MKFIDEVDIMVVSGQAVAPVPSASGVRPWFRVVVPMVATAAKVATSFSRRILAFTLFSIFVSNETIALKTAKRALARNNSRQGRRRSRFSKFLPAPSSKMKTAKFFMILSENTRIVLLEGGLGGKGNTFYKTSVNQAPTVAQKGLSGKEKELHLELKLLADVGIIGLPNAGKSTLISRISSAKPKIADYPFTTLVPNLGVVKFAEDLTIIVADIPGLIEGASHGAGLGMQFLRHIERTRTFVHLIDASDMAGKAPWDAYTEIRNELKAYDESKENEDEFIPLLDRPEIIVLNKIDSVDRIKVKQAEALFRDKGYETLSISAATGENIKELIQLLGKKVFSEHN